MGSPTQARTVAERVTDALRTRILAGQYEPGAPLRQDAVAAELGVSRIPLREALNHLEAEGLVLGLAHRGFIVREMNRKDADELFSLRLQLEPAAVAEAAQLATVADQDAVRRLLERLKTAARQRDAATASELGRAISIALCAPSQRPITAELLSRLHAISQRYVSRHLNGSGAPNIPEFELLYEIWRGRRGDEAAAIVTHQVARTRDRVMEALAG
jgi:DNA-binding GntR family transcriptional regulator